MTSPHVNLSHGPQTLAIPGPSIMPPSVLAAFARPIPDIYEGELIDVSDELVELLPQIVGTTTAEQFITISNGHGGWEMALANLIQPGDKVLVANSGVFGAAWGEMAVALGAEIVQIDAEPGRGVSPEALRARLEADTRHEFKAVLTTHVETATSVRHDIPGFRAALDAAGHPALLMVDAIASLGCDELRMDAWGIDVVVAGSQKGLMTPPGLAFVWAGPKAVEANARVLATGGVRSWYWSWEVRRNPTAHYYRYAGTPPVNHLFALHEAVSLILAEGMPNVWARHAALAGAVRAAVGAWSTPGGLALNVRTPAEQANSVTMVRTGAVDAEALRAVTRTDFGLTLGIGLGAGDSFRIGHMGYLSGVSVLGVLATIESALDRLGAPMGGSGVAAAAAALARPGDLVP